MNPIALPLPDLVGTLIGLVFTLFIFSYIFGDNFLFRLAIHIFIGVSAGFAAVVAVRNVILPQLVIPFLEGGSDQRILLIIPIFLSLLLLAKVFNRVAGWGTVVMAILVGIGAATAIGGAVIGTIFTQVEATTSGFSAQNLARPGVDFVLRFFESSLILVGTLSTLIFFHFGAYGKHNQPGQRPIYMEWIAQVGQVFIAITFGVLFAGVYSAALAALVERLTFITSFLSFPP
jgi:hypothetical protein